MATPSDAFVFFGATGDLAYKQVFPSLQAMVRAGTLDVPVIGVAKAGWDLDQLKKRAQDSLEEHGGMHRRAFAKLKRLMRYVDGDYADPQTFARLREELGRSRRPLHYLAIPPALFGTVAQSLHDSGCAPEGTRIVVEKPFGRDLASAQALNRELHKVFPEEAIFRIDHYLGKEPVENLTFYRFANGFLEPIWNRHNIASVQVTMAESFGVQGRGAFYDSAGAIRDVVQNHMLQIVSLLAMEPPAGNEPDDFRNRKAELVRATSPLRKSDVVRGQFRGYRDEPGVAKDSTVETFAAVRLHIPTWRWAGVPFLIRAGKCMPETVAEVLVGINPPPVGVFKGERRHHDTLRFRLQPDVAIGLGVRIKKEGMKMVGEDVELIVQESPADDMPPYQRLLGDALNGDAGLFARQDYVEAAWRVVDPILGDVVPVVPYDPGTWGPEEANRITPGGDIWHDPEPSNG